MIYNQEYCMYILWVSLILYLIILFISFVKYNEANVQFEVYTNCKPIKKSSLYILDLLYIIVF